MRSTKFVLISPGPVDGYPPVQYQARLLAAAGYSVEIVTSPLSREQDVPLFSCPGVRVSCLSPTQAFSGRLQRNVSYVRALLAARMRAGQQATEICYDPIGVFLSDYTPFKPRRRVAHFHELLQYPDSFLEKRLRRAIENFRLVVVPDAARAIHTQSVLELKETPLVIENYPLRANKPLASAKSSRRFEVVYCGSLGFNQKLDLAIRSSAFWPDGAYLVLIGNATTRPAQALKELAASINVAHRVEFLGWMETHTAECRLADANLGIGLLSTDSEQLRTALGASNKRFQYMKAGLPQVGDQNPGIPQLIEENGIGTCLRGHDPAELAGVVSAYMRDSARCRSEGARAFDLHHRLYNYEAVFSRLLERLVGMQ